MKRQHIGITVAIFGALLMVGSVTYALWTISGTVGKVMVLFIGGIVSLCTGMAVSED